MTIPPSTRPDSFPADANDAALTPKARQTRAHILTTALALFAERGYQETTMREIATAAEISLGLTYRYFARKEELILAFYQQCTQQLADEVQRLPAAPLATRFTQAIRADLALIAPHRDAMTALIGVGLAPRSEVAVLGERIAGIRKRIWEIFREVVTGATDGPKPRQAQGLATLFYTAHLLTILFWLQDRSPSQRATEDLLRFMQETTSRLRPLLSLPPVAKSVTRLVRILDPMFGPGDTP